jgi:hypothetical protein
MALPQLLSVGLAEPQHASPGAQQLSAPATVSQMAPSNLFFLPASLVVICEFLSKVKLS